MNAFNKYVTFFFLDAQAATFHKEIMNIIILPLTL